MQPSDDFLLFLFLTVFTFLVCCLFFSFNLSSETRGKLEIVQNRMWCHSASCRLLSVFVTGDSSCHYHTSADPSAHWPDWLTASVTLAPPVETVWAFQPQSDVHQHLTIRQVACFSSTLTQSAVNVIYLDDVSPLVSPNHTVKRFTCKIPFE